MKLSLLKHSAWCLLITLNLMGYECQAQSAMVEPHLANNDLVLMSVIFRPGYSVNIENHYGEQFYILPDTYHNIQISTQFEKGGREQNFPCQPMPITIKEKDHLTIKVVSYKNKPDQALCTLTVKQL